jgi:putative DNA primase/helicase
MMVYPIMQRVRGLRANGRGWLALCPSHDDHNPSLSISTGDDGRVLLHCFAGCSLEQICAALGIDRHDLGVQDSVRAPVRDSSSATTATYDYQDEQKALLYQVVRFQPKRFSQRRPDGKSAWIWNLNRVRRVLYRLPELIASDQASVVFICEGEKDADRLRSLGSTATTNAGGAGKWRNDYNDALRNRHVCILPDNDRVGREHANKIANSLRGIAATVRILDLPDLQDKGDVSDWLDAGGTIEELQRLATNTPEALTNQNQPVSESDEKLLQRLAELSPLEYDRQRDDAAKRLGCRTATLDKLVEAKRPKPIDAHDEPLQGRAVLFADAELWPEFVTGADALDAISKTLCRYIALPDGASDALALWCAHAHAFDAFVCTPRLNITSPEKQCGKTTLRDVLIHLVPRPLPTENMSVAVLFRIIEAHRPTILADECDAWLRDNEDLRGLMNAGHRRGGRVLRCEGEGNEVRAFDVFAPAVLCGIGSLPGTLHDRSIVIRLSRAKAGELSERFDSRRTDHEQVLRQKLARFCADHRAALESCDPLLPPGVFNRLADNWRPLFAVAEIVGGHWPQRTAAAFAKLTSREDADTQGIGTMLLADIRYVFEEVNADRIFSKALVERLCGMTDRPWPEAHKGRAITEPWLASRLKTFGIKPKTLRIESDRAKGYEVSHFEEAFERYLPDPVLSVRDIVTNQQKSVFEEHSARDNKKACHGSDSKISSINIDLSRCHASDGPDLLHEEIAERAAIMEFDGGLAPEEAERRALASARR